MLDGVGLGEAEERAYRLLLRVPSLTAREIATHMETPPGISRRAADALVEIGLANADDATPARYTAIDPRIAIPALVRMRQAELARTSAALPSYAAEYQERMLRTEPQRLVEVLDGPGAITERVSTLLRSAEEEVLAFDEPPYVGGTPSANTDEYDLLARGVAVRAVYAAEALSIDGKADDIRDLVERGEQARVVPHVPLKMVLVDRRAAVIPLTARAESVRTTAVVVWQSRLCDALIELFEATWERATPVFALASAVPDMEAVDRELLSLLNAGLKDETIARQLGLSERTVRRRVADLLSRLGATSRFQAGAKAAARGWI
ncbi:helix-turn-helix transcriptional regulator [Microbacterium mangrovi]|uniref:helix-turn-helix transcriptional regulator n=1 Tax=Microbacterium mangrovi TaxID=1348253 RepID=UPI000B0152BF|nr:LuxR family transcriptional regulator [Microbacterium mangrovi]